MDFGQGGEILWTGGTVRVEDVAQAIDEILLLDHGDVVVAGILEDFLRQCGPADADHIAEETAGLAHGQQIFFHYLGLADGKFILDASKECLSVGVEVGWEAAAEVSYQVFGGYAVFAVHQPQAARPGKKEVDFSMWEAGADVFSRFDF